MLYMARYNVRKALFGKKNRKRFSQAKKVYGKVSGLAKKVAFITSMMNVEKKHLDTDLASQTFGANDGFIQSITAPAHGDAANQRNGNSIKLASYQITGRITQQTSVQNAIKGKIWLISYDQTPDVPTISEFLDTDGAGNYSSLSLRNPDKMGDFKILASKSFYCPQRAVTGLETDTTFKLFGKFNNMHQRFTGSAASTITSNQLYLIFAIDDGTTAASTGAYIKGLKARINYIDN